MYGRANGSSVYQGKGLGASNGLQQRVELYMRAKRLSCISEQRSLLVYQGEGFELYIKAKWSSCLSRQMGLIDV